MRSLVVSMGLALLLAGRGVAQEDAGPTWPKVSLASDYKVDPRWPRRPAELPWGHIPGIAVDARDNVYVYSRSDDPVQVYDASGKFLRTWGRGVLKSAHHIRVDGDGNVWTTDIERHVVEKYTPEGKRLLILGTPNHKGADETHLDMPTDVAVSPAGDVFVADGYGNSRVVRYDKSGKFVRAWGKLGSKPGEFSIPHSIAWCKGRVYVADRNNVRIQVFDPDGKLLDVWNDLLVPWGFAVTKADELWVCGSSPMRWRPTDEALGCPPKDQVFLRFNTEGKLLQLWTVPKGLDGLERPGELNWVHCLAVDSKGNLYAGDIIGKRAQKFVPVGK